MQDSKIRRRIAIVGSINMDLVIQCESFPKPGETISAKGYRQIPGGKGANQAVSAARTCTPASMLVNMIGRVGDDDYGVRLLESLESYDIECANVIRTRDCESGLAFITVQSDGQNSIAIIGGANAELTPDDVQRSRREIESSSLLLLQLEVPIDTVLEAIRIAKSAKVPIVLDPTPVPGSVPEELLQVDILCPNVHEAAAIAGTTISTQVDVERSAEALFHRGVKNVVITLGEKGAYVFNERGGRIVPAFPVNAMDTTAAGDAFAGAMAVRWIETGDLDEAVHWGNAAGSIAASRFGAQTSMGSRSEIEALWRTRS